MRRTDRFQDQWMSSFTAAAHVGGIERKPGAPAEVHYDTNLMMGAQFLHECWRAGVHKVRCPVGTVCELIPSSRRSRRSAKTTCGSATPRRPTRRTAWRRRCCWCRPRPTASSTATTQSSCCPPTCTVPATASTSNAHVIPMLIRKFLEAQQRASTPSDAEVVVWGTGRPSRHAPSSCTWTTRPKASCWRPSATTAEPANLGSGYEISVRSSWIPSRASQIFTDVLCGTAPVPTDSRAASSTRAVPSVGFGFHATTGFAEGLTTYHRRLPSSDARSPGA